MKLERFLLEPERILRIQNCRVAVSGALAILTLMETTAELLGIDTTGEIDPGELTELEGFRSVPNFDTGAPLTVVLGVGSGIFLGGVRVAN